ncbi:MAG: DinB family protein [Gemmatimonadaceae bacterium]
MKLNDFFLGELDREANRSREVLLQVPADKYDWKPHDKSMKFGYLADLVAIIPTWIAMQVTKDELDIAPADGAQMPREPKTTSAALVVALDASLVTARNALAGTNDDHLNTKWQLKARGNVVQEAPRYQMIQDTFNHWVHHRGQMTVYLRLLGAKVPATYGPSADEQAFR